MIHVNVTDIARGNQFAHSDYAERLDRRYAQHVRQLARELGIATAGKTKRDLIDQIAALLARGQHPHVVLAWRLHD